jgi:uncharacterized Zn ribbon protein
MPKVKVKCKQCTEEFTYTKHIVTNKRKFCAECVYKRNKQNQRAWENRGQMSLKDKEYLESLKRAHLLGSDWCYPSEVL